MIRPLHACALALCVVAVPSLHAATFTAYGEDHLDLAAPTPTNLVPTFTATTIHWNWSSNFTSAVQSLGLSYSDGTVRPANFVPTSSAFSLVSMTVDGPDDAGSLTVLSEQLGGSISFSSQSGPLTDQSATLTLSDLRIDHQGNQVFARVGGADQAIFEFDDTAYVLPPGSYSQVLTCMPTNPNCISRLDAADSHPVLSNLRFTAQGRTLWDQTFQLNPLGRVMMDSVGTLGTMTASPVPEASTWALMGVGLFGIGLARRRHRRD